MPDFMPGFFIIAAGIILLVARNPLAVMQNAAIDQFAKGSLSKKISIEFLKKMLTVGSFIFMLIGVCLILVSVL